ncbi:hypothetical protein ASPZODRAFT_64068 [Penicilliopsis zonata CBS 506.65]|uniref:Major facilitator superfamily (MFS) profile domain-containing protein n=1 Tax=Penicilliopsis zonata CBS 506.65 TaxID=1073090 RepID=A0A1L9SKR7_9EURO|nr:hypothetical protein ASPZODRAFT_64068 [Penicilliopsis zonata CBS 506.65]OJJ47696.1 hypothetical protein ASPZODRAFT_64068 [Penicilliopsis zonata CBS 506.65]
MIEYVGVPQHEVAKWVGIVSAVVASCQCAMAIPWGTASDRFGRKPVILFGLTCTMIFSLAFGFSRSLLTLILSRALLGFMNGNVGIIRTMVAEMVPERELQPRAFSIMPLVWTIGSIFGPAFGGALARPAEKHPELFGDSEFLKKYPFALPNILSAMLFILGISTGFLFLKETLANKKDQRDYGLVLGEMLTSSIPCGRRRPIRSAKIDLGFDETSALLGDEEDRVSRKQARMTVKERKPKKKASWADVFSPQSNLILLAYGLMAMHCMAFDSLLPVFLHYPEQEFEGNPDVKLPFKFAGGFGVGRSFSKPTDSQMIGMFYTLIGIIGMFIQFLVFPPAAKRYGVLFCFKVVSIIFPIIYALTPFTVLIEGPLRNFSVFLLMLGKLACGIFSFPCCTILLTNSAATLEVLGTLNGVGTSVSAVGRATGPAIVGAMFSFGIKRGYLIIPWGALTIMGALSAFPVFWIFETDGFMGNDEDDDDDDEIADESEDNDDFDDRTYGATTRSK